jgi:hypothetical protein
VWTKISGDAASQGGSYGTRGVFSSSNHPGVRASAGCVFESSGFLWLFGGRGMGYQLFVGTSTINLIKILIFLLRHAERSLGV